MRSKRAKANNKATPSKGEEYKYMRLFFLRLMPILYISLAIIMLSYGLMLLFYLIIVSSVLMSLVSTFSWLQAKFFPTLLKRKQTRNKDDGKTIKIDEWHIL